MVNEKLLVGALKDGALLVHADPAIHAGLLLRPGAKQAEMGTGRSMGPGWIRVDAAGIDEDAALTSWLHTALEFNRAATGNGRCTRRWATLAERCPPAWPAPPRR
ncbi:hypothetical protein ACT3TP_16690 [Glutamicibacter sp. AOP38-B1-38]|uniref:hypothetical protein n=1 Tax=Glutamicibacter sp. AOP38-B1-38 TaxID=3457680 RepID=UPI0040338241